MSSRIVRVALLAALFAVFGLAPAAYADGSETPSPPPSGGKSSPPKDQKNTDRRSGVDDPAFIARYRAAYATVYERNDYAAAIAQLKALGHDDRADVANLIGYSYRKLGNYDLAKVWYERALEADPAHIKTWQYYGLWQIEQGHRDRAAYHLRKLEALCGTGCPEYRSLAAALDNNSGY